MTDYETKDSGKRAEYDSGMRRDTDEGKARLDLVYWPMVRRWADLMQRGAIKYGEENWRLADSTEEATRFRSSLLRHLDQYLSGETDEDHAAAVFYNLSALEYLREVKNVILPPL
jgi:dATP/dGTP diphosphohydrolase